jgi:hypothetical protein
LLQHGISLINSTEATMHRQSLHPQRRATLRDTLGLAGGALLLYAMVASVAAHREPDWPVFWSALAAFFAWATFYGKCARVVEDFIATHRENFSTHDGMGRAD